MLAAHVADRPPIEAAERGAYLGVQLAQGGVLDLVLALDLADDQLESPTRSSSLAPSACARSMPSKSPVLGDVVGRRTDRLTDLFQHLPSGVATTAAIAAGPGFPWPRRPRSRPDAGSGQSRVSVPSSAALAFQSRSLAGSSEISLPFDSSLTVSPLTRHRYQEVPGNHDQGRVRTRQPHRDPGLAQWRTKPATLRAWPLELNTSSGLRSGARSGSSGSSASATGPCRSPSMRRTNRSRSALPTHARRRSGPRAAHRRGVRGRYPSRRLGATLAQLAHPTVSPSPLTYWLTRSPRRIVRPQIAHASAFGFGSVTAAT